LSENISKNNFKVSISGTAADEVYSGYYDHHLQYLYDTRNKKKFNLYKKNFKELVKPLIRNIYLKNLQRMRLIFTFVSSNQKEIVYTL
jgi:asparagine synthase (glutamine-hydrolysing)